MTSDRLQEIDRLCFHQGAQICDLRKGLTEAVEEIWRWKRAIEPLTPGGSEYVNDPANCAEFIRKMRITPKMMLDLRRENEQLRTAIKLAAAALSEEAAK